MVPSGAMEASSLGEGFQVRSSSGSLAPVSEHYADCSNENLLSIHCGSAQ